MISQNKNQKNVIYKATSKTTGKPYIGLTTKAFKKRYDSHKSSAFLSYIKAYECKFYRAIRKYGFDDFEWEIIDKAETEEELKEKEIYWISYYDSFKTGYNMTLGGDGTSGIMGENHGQAKLTEEDVVRIKTALIQGISQPKLAKAYDVRQTMINNIATDKNWTHVVVEGWSEWLELKSRGEFIPPNYQNRDKGSKHINAKLSEEKVAKVKHMLMEKVAMEKIANEFSVSRSVIHAVARNEAWTHVDVDGWGEYQLERSKGRIRENKGSSNGMAVFNEEKVMEIKRLLVQGTKQKDIAKLLNTSPATIGSIAQGRNWEYVTVEGWEEYQKLRKAKRKVS